VNLKNVLLGALGMYAYLRWKGYTPPPYLKAIEDKIASLLKKTPEVVEETTKALVPSEGVPEEKPKKKPPVPPGFRMPALEPWK